jgi:hypothetical protein
MPSARDIASTIVGLERSLDLGDPDWLLGDMHLWPIYRLEIYRRLFVGQSTQASTGVRRQLGPICARLAASTVRAAAPHSVWLVSDGISYTRIGERELERFCSPLHDACQALGIDAVLIDRASPAMRDCREPQRWWAPMTQRAKFVAMLRARLAPDHRHERLVARIDAQLRPLSSVMPLLDARRLDAMSRAVLQLADVLARRMRAERVRNVFVVGYYDVSGYAYVLAAARAGVRAVDVQHGVTGPLHMAYADWHAHPTAGLALLPRWYWCWTDADAAVVERWLPQVGLDGGGAVVGGHPFLCAWRAGRIGLDEHGAARLQQLCAAAGGRPCVLVTLQPNVLSAAALAPLLEAFSARPDVAWWLRLHPMAWADRGAVESLLRERSVDCWNIDDATALPLPALLAVATAHATHSSSVVVEAGLLGVPSLVWSTYGAELFADAITQGSALAVTDGAAFVAALRRPHSQARHGAAESDPTVQALRALLEPSP